MLYGIQSKNPDFCVMTLTETLPPHRFDINVIEPVGATEIKILRVLCFLYWLYVQDLESNDRDFSIKISKQSIINDIEVVLLELNWYSFSVRPNNKLS